MSDNRQNRPPRRRRRLLLAGLATAAALVVAVTGLVAWRWSAAGVTTIGKVSFTHHFS